MARLVPREEQLLMEKVWLGLVDSTTSGGVPWSGGGDVHLASKFERPTPSVHDFFDKHNRIKTETLFGKTERRVDLGAAASLATLSSS